MFERHGPTVLLRAFAPAVALGLTLSCLVALQASAQGLPNDPRRPGYLEVRERANYRDPNEFYWEGFRLKNDGECDGAIDRLKPLATRGRGFEQAQLALGICQLRLAGMPQNAATALPNAEKLRTDPDFSEGVTWIERAAEAGTFEAQRTLIALYVAGVGPSEDPVDLGSWLHLYDVNPMRLSLGAQENDTELLNRARAMLSDRQELLGRARARQWVPSFWAPAPVASTIGKPEE
jgi:hypothetical protein